MQFINVLASCVSLATLYLLESVFGIAGEAYRRKNLLIFTDSALLSDSILYLLKKSQNVKYSS
jgi:hypothetical protein